MSYIVLVDSASDIPSDQAMAEDIVTVPMAVTIDGQTLFEGIDLNSKVFYAQFDQYKDLPKTSQPNPNTLLEYYEKILSKGSEVVAIHLSSGLSSTVATAQMLRSSTSAPERVHIIDSRGASLGYGLLALAARQILKSSEASLSWSEIEAEIMRIRKAMRYVFTPDTLEYLVKGGESQQNRWSYRWIVGCQTYYAYDTGWENRAFY